ncbi:MAG TPA: response regulator [Anaerolineales bacterium]|nr:response regulator [Anaerolineales bacterium]
MATTRIVLADDHAVVRAGLRNALTGQPDLAVVSEVGNGPDLMAAVREHTPDLIVIDVAMPDFEPVAAVRTFKTEYPGMRILVVSAYADEGYLVGLLGAGVDGYHLKDQPLADLQLAVQRVIEGERWVPAPLVDRLVHRQPTAPRATPVLTRRQRELLRLLMQGFDNRKIAQAMELSVKTVENHLTSLYRSLAVESRLEATHFAMRYPEVLRDPEPVGPTPESKTEGVLTVLLVDDNPRYREQMARLIGKTHPASRVIEAGDIADALQAAERIHPHLALVDVVLRDEDGIQCTRRIKTVSPETRVVLISAYPDREFRRLGFNAGAVAYLDKKDLDVAAVRQVIQDTLGSLSKPGE